ncbi:MAG TPA: hypothetical protein VFS43_24075 [Polyangiaceae bacterium]|nr:hypothetical protein [Polyangiaceae bacterium]
MPKDATGVSIQPGPIAERAAPGRTACRKGHFFVVLADKDHIFFEDQPKHTSAAVCAMFRGFSRYVQADAHAVDDALFRGGPPKGVPPDEPRGPPPTEVGCRVGGGRCRPPPLTDPDVQISRIRFFTGQVRSGRRSDERFVAEAAGAWRAAA